MPGRPKRTHDLVALDRIGAERVEDLLASAMPLAAVCRELKVGKQALFAWLEADASRTGLLARARARAAHTLADEVLEIADSADASEVQVAKLRVESRRWLASKWNAAAYGEQKGQNITIDVGSMFLTASKKPGDNAQVIDAAPHKG